MVVGSCQNDIYVCRRCCRCNNLHLKYVSYKKFYCHSKNCLYSGLSKLFSHFQKLDLKSNPSLNGCRKLSKRFICLSEMLSLQQLTLKVSVIQKILLSEQTLLIQWSVKTLFAFSEVSNTSLNGCRKLSKRSICLSEMLSLQQLTLKVSVIQKIFLSEQTLLIHWSVKTLFAFSEVSFKE